MNRFQEFLAMTDEQIRAEVAKLPEVMDGLNREECFQGWIDYLGGMNKTLKSTADRHEILASAANQMFM